MKSPAGLLAAIGLTAFTAAGCSSQEPGVVLDLVGRVAVAERASTHALISFGTPDSEPHLAEGFHRWAGGEPGDRYVWARQEVEIALDLPERADRAAVVDLRPFEGISDQRVSVKLNGTDVVEMPLDGRRHRYRIPLPREAQRQGENRLRFEFAESSSMAELNAGSGDGGRLAAAFYGMVIGAAADESLDDLLRRDAPWPFAVHVVEGVPGFDQVGAGSVRFASRVPAGGRFLATAELHPGALAAAGGATVVVTLETERGEREIYRRELSARGETSFQLDLPLRVPGGEVVRLGLHVESSGDRFAWIRWKAPRLVGSTSETARDSTAGDWLREALRDSNVVLVFMDAARASSFGSYGHERPTTPNFDRIAAAGVVFDRAFTPAVYTLGAMSSVWTSTHPDRHHSETAFDARLPEGILTLAELLTAQGVRTAGFVANAVAGRAFGFDRGFVEFHEVFATHGSEASAMRSVLPSWWRDAGAGRFFAYVHYREPHFPFDPREPFLERLGADVGPIPKPLRSDMSWITDVNRGERSLSEEEERQLRLLYEANLAQADDALGELVAGLEGAGLLEETLLIITADHGEALHEHGWIGHNVQLYEESVRVPLVMRFPAGTGPRGVRNAELVDLLDLAPTIADVFGALDSGGAREAFSGISLLDVAAGGPGKRAVLSRTVWNRPRYSWRDEKLKLIFDTQTGEQQLFDLERDPGENTDRSELSPLLAAYARQELFARLGELAGPPSRSTPSELTPEQCENLVSLGYIDGCS